jgi:tetratricopeptide (TPR) repeat protein
MISAMDPNQWIKVKEAFEVALSLDIQSRADYLRHISGSDERLAGQLAALLQADDAAGDFLEEGHRFAPENLVDKEKLIFEPKEIICGRFEIVRLIGSGGMGQVYEALDFELGVQVALKTIRAEIAENSAMLARFRQEVKLARRITHTNICRTFDIQRDRGHVLRDGRLQDVTFLTMEYLDGETLAARLKRQGRLPLPEVRYIAGQLSSALMAAHLMGVVHRDIKPANVMLVPGGSQLRVVITDFGLAHFTAIANGTQASSDGTGTGIGILGTPAYMAPEQAEGASVTPQTDIYSFGMVIFEMSTGMKARGDTVLTVSEMRLPNEIVDGLPNAWARAIARCLQLRPDDRFQNAEDVIAEMDTATCSIVLNEANKGFRVSRWVQHLGIAAFLCVVALVAGLIYMRGRPTRMPVGATIYLAPIRNRTGDNSIAGVDALVRNQLGQSAQFNMLDTGRVGDTLQQMMKPTGATIDDSTAREVAMRNGAARLVLGTVSNHSGVFELKLEVQQMDNDPRRARHSWKKSWYWQTGIETPATGAISVGLLAAVRDGSAWIRREVGESADDVARMDTPPEDVTTSDWNALMEYGAAEQFYLENRRDDAVQALRNATHADPGFALAYARMGDILLSQGRAVEGYQAYRAALTDAMERRLTRRERDRIRGIYALDTMDFATAEEVFRDYAAYYEHDYRPWFYRGYPLVMLGRNDEAVGVEERAHTIDPSRIQALDHLARFEILRGNFNASQKWITEMRKNKFSAVADYDEALDAFMNDKPVDAENLLKRAMGSEDTYFHAFALATLGRLFAELGRRQEAISVLQRAAEEAAKAGDNATQAYRIIDLAYLHCKLKQFATCLAESEQARHLEASPDMALQVARVLGMVVRNGDASFVPQVKAQLSEWQREIPTDNNSVIHQLARLRLKGELQLAEGDWSAAVATFREASALDAPAEGREYMGRAFMIGAEHSVSSVKATGLRQEAAAAYARIALRPAYVWHRPAIQPPGYLADERFDYSLAQAGIVR